LPQTPAIILMAEGAILQRIGGQHHLTLGIGTLTDIIPDEHEPFGCRGQYSPALNGPPQMDPNGGMDDDPIVE